ncbi:MAG TPA: hypothetical protein VEU30_12680 [Thermoanaerobaculia bacterium]|nr:hypothetical protein [Thermoanaerobaculia bacterium]
MPDNLTHDPGSEIRRFFIHPQPSYSLGELARLWRIEVDDVCAIFADELASAGRVHDTDAFRVTRDDALGAATVFHLFRPIEVERALGAAFDRVRAAHWRTVPIVVHLPRYLTDVIMSLPLVPARDDLAARAERLLCEAVEAEWVCQGIGSTPETES